MPKPKPNDKPKPDELKPVPNPPPGSGVLFPLPGSRERVNKRSFGQGRPFGSPNPTRHHSGVDVDADYLDPVRMPETGTVREIQGWSGPGTRGVIVQLHSGPVVVLGAVHPDHLPNVGKTYERGELVARIGRYPHGSTMLHFEMWHAGAERVKWRWGKPAPATLVNPTAYLEGADRG